MANEDDFTTCEIVLVLLLEVAQVTLFVVPLSHKDLILPHGSSLHRILLYHTHLRLFIILQVLLNTHVSQLLSMLLIDIQLLLQIDSVCSADYLGMLFRMKLLGQVHVALVRVSILIGHLLLKLLLLELQCLLAHCLTI